MKREAYDPQRLVVMEANLGTSELCVAQVNELLRLFGPGVSRLRAVKLVAPRITDRSHAAQIVETFAFENERREARAALWL